MPESDFEFDPQRDGSFRVKHFATGWKIGTTYYAYKYWQTEPPTGPHATRVEAAEALVKRVSSKRTRQL